MSDSTGYKKAVRHARDERIVQMRAQGATLQSIASEFGLTRERVRQIVNRQGGVDASRVRQARRDADHARVRAWVSEHPDSTLGDVAKGLGWSPARVSGLLDLRERRLLQAHRHRSAPVYPDWQVLAALRSAAALHQGPLSGRVYDQFVHAGRVQGPTAARVVQRFGSWSTACGLAGVQAGRRLRRSYERYWDRGVALAAMREYLLDPQSRGTFAGWDQWRRGRSEVLPCAVTLRTAFSSWSQLKELALTQESAA